MDFIASLSRFLKNTTALSLLDAFRRLALIPVLALILLSCQLSSQSVQTAPFPTPSSTSTLVRVTPPTSNAEVGTPFDKPETPSPSFSPTVTRIQAATPSSTPTILPLECLPENGDDEYGLVQWISGSDTIVVDLQGRLRTIRYLGIHSPADSPIQENMGPPAATQNASLVQGQVVRMVQDGLATDSLGRLLRYVLVYDTGIFVNFELLRLGFAQVEMSTPPLACQEIFLQAQQIAQQAQVGLWAPTPSRIPTATRLPTRTSTASPTGTLSPTPTGTPPTSTISPTGTLSPTVTGTPPTSTTGPTTTLSPTVTGTPPTSTASPTNTLSPTPTGTLPTSTTSPST